MGEQIVRVTGPLGDFGFYLEWNGEHLAGVNHRDDIVQGLAWIS